MHRIHLMPSPAGNTFPAGSTSDPAGSGRIVRVRQKKHRALLPVGAALLMLCLPSAAASLSVQEAQAVIVRYFGYPAPAPHATVCGELDSPVWKGFQTLLDQGYLAPNRNRSFQYEPRLIPTEKGQPYIRRGPTFNVLVRDYCMQVHVCTIVFKGITRLEVDEAHGKAHVEYATGFEPIEPFYSLFCTDRFAPGCWLYAGRKLAETTGHVVYLKKTAKGWEVETSPEGR
jgi:hypothetical protein